MAYVAIYTLSTIANAIPYSQFQTKFKELWEPTSFVSVCPIVDILNYINVNFFQYLYTTIWNDV